MRSFIYFIILYGKFSGIYLYLFPLENQLYEPQIPYLKYTERMKKQPTPFNNFFGLSRK